MPFFDALFDFIIPIIIEEILLSIARQFSIAHG